MATRKDIVVLHFKLHIGVLQIWVRYADHHHTPGICICKVYTFRCLKGRNILLEYNVKHSSTDSVLLVFAVTPNNNVTGVHY